MIEQLFRVPFFVVGLVLLKYSRAVLTSSVALVLLAVFAFEHPSGNNAGEEIAAFAVTWVVALVCASVLAALSGALDSLWSFELSWTSIGKHGIDVVGAAAFMISAVVAFLVYLSTEVLGYSDGTFNRVQALVWLFLIMLLVSMYDYVVRKYHLVPPAQRWHHCAVLWLFAVAILADILVQDIEFWPYVLGGCGAWLALYMATRVMVWLAGPEMPARTKRE